MKNYRAFFNGKESIVTEEQKTAIEANATLRGGIAFYPVVEGVADVKTFPETATIADKKKEKDA